MLMTPILRSCVFHGFIARWAEVVTNGGAYVDLTLVDSPSGETTRECRVMTRDEAAAAFGGVPCNS